MIDKIKNEIINRFKTSNWKDITITMRADGSKLTLTPCSENIKIKSADDINWVLVHGPGVAAQFGGTLDAVAKQLAEYSDRKQEYLKDVGQLHAYCKKHKGSGYGREYDFYADWHKDIFGFRPDGWTVGVPRQNARMLA